MRLTSTKPAALQRCKVTGHRRLRQSDTFLNTAHANPDRMNVTFILRREVLCGILQTLHDFEAGPV